MEIILVIFTMTLLVIVITRAANHTKERKYKKLETEFLAELGVSSWDVFTSEDDIIIVKSRQALENYDEMKFFKEDRERLSEAEDALRKKNILAVNANSLLENIRYKSHPSYLRLVEQVKETVSHSDAYRIRVAYISSAGNYLGDKDLYIYQGDIDRFNDEPSLLMGKGEYNKYLREKQKEILNQKHYAFYQRVNTLIDFANKYRDTLVIKESCD